MDDASESPGLKVRLRHEMDRAIALWRDYWQFKWFRVAAYAAGAALLALKAARKEFGGLVAVNDVSFEVKAGDIVGLIGPNGAGKSTTFNLVTGVLDVTRGEITFKGQPIAGSITLTTLYTSFDPMFNVVEP